MNNSLKKSQQGLSLLELMISMFIGLFLLVGIASSYLSSKKTSVQRDEYSLLQENGRLALDIMSQTIVHSGYKAFPSGNINPSSFITDKVVSATCNNGDGESVLQPNLFTADSTKNGPLNSSDSIGVVYLGDDFIFTDCSGNTLPAGCRISETNQNSDTASIYSAFFIADSTLQCTGSRANASEVIAEGIENMQVLYGINIDDDPEVDRYINASQVAAFEDNIVSVQIAVLVRSSREVKDFSESKVYSLLDNAYTSPNDRFMRAVFTNTINLRNTL